MLGKSLRRGRQYLRRWGTRSPPARRARRRQRTANAAAYADADVEAARTCTLTSGMAPSSTRADHHARRGMARRSCARAMETAVASTSVSVAGSCSWHWRGRARKGRGVRRRRGYTARRGRSRRRLEALADDTASWRRGWRGRARLGTWPRRQGRPQDLPWNQRLHLWMLHLLGSTPRGQRR